MKKEKSNYTIQIVEQAFNVLEQFQNHDDELSLTELSRRLKLHKNKIFRLLATLSSQNYIERNTTTESYRLGIKNLQLGQTFIQQMGLLHLAKPALESLVRKCNETSYVSVMKDYKIVYLDVVESNLPVRVFPRLGVRLPIYCTASGKILAAYMCEENLCEYFSAGEMKKYTSNTICDPGELIKSFRRITAQGYAVDNEELEIGVKCIGAPIRDYTRQVIGAVSVSGPAMRMSPARITDELIPLVMEAAQEISIRLGHD